MNNTDKHKHIRVSMVSNMYYRLLPLQISAGLVIVLNNLIDSLFTSKYLGAEGLAVIGFYTPLSKIICFSMVMITGAQILCGNSIGRGKNSETVSLFSTCAAVLLIFAGVFAAVLLVFSSHLARMLGASGHVAVMLAQYLRCVSFGNIGLVMYSLFKEFLDLNSRRTLSWISIITVFASNLVLNILFIKYMNLGIAGLGLATSFSYILAMLVSLPGVIKSKHSQAVYLQKNDLCFKRVKEMRKLGSTQMAYNATAAIKAYAMNLLLMKIGGTDAVAVAAVLNTIFSFVEMIPNGTSSTTLTLGSIFSGEKNRAAMEELLNVSLRVGAILSVIAIAVVEFAAPQIASIYFVEGSSIYPMTVEMLRIFVWWVGFASIVNNIISIHQCQRKMLIANLAKIAENVYTAGFIFMLSAILGIRGIWLAYPAAELLNLVITSIFISSKLKHYPKNLGEWAGLGTEFDVHRDDWISVEVKNMSQVVNVSSDVIAFLKDRNCDPKTCNLAGLAVEEMAGNIVEHGFKDNQKHAIDIYMIKEDDALIIRIRDDCRMFDPTVYMKQFNLDDPMKNVGIKLVERTAKEMKYQRILDYNYLTVTI